MRWPRSGLPSASRSRPRTRYTGSSPHARGSTLTSTSTSGVQRAGSTGTRSTTIPPRWISSISSWRRCGATSTPIMRKLPSGAGAALATRSPSRRLSSTVRSSDVSSGPVSRPWIVVTVITPPRSLEEQVVIDACCDVVLELVDVLEHLRDPARALESSVQIADARAEHGVEFLDRGLLALDCRAHRLGSQANSDARRKSRTGHCQRPAPECQPGAGAAGRLGHCPRGPRAEPQVRPPPRDVARPERLLAVHHLVASGADLVAADRTGGGGAHNRQRLAAEPGC